MSGQRGSQRRGPGQQEQQHVTVRAGLATASAAVIPEPADDSEDEES